MKKHFKRVFAILLICLMTMATLIPAQAAQNGMILTYKGKNVRLFSKNGTEIKYTTLKKYWGAGKVKSKDAYGRVTYLYKQGKSYLEALDSGKANNHYTSYNIVIKDKNMKMNGVYVGMSKTTAIKKLKAAFGSGKTSYEIDGKKQYIVTEVKSKKLIYVYFAYFMPITLKYNAAGKITSITFWCS